MYCETFWRHCGGTGCTKHFTYPATAKIVAKQVARKVELNSTVGNGSCNLPRNDFGRCRVCYTVKIFRATQLSLVAKTLREKLHETFHSVTAPLRRQGAGRSLHSSRAIHLFMSFVSMARPQPIVFIFAHSLVRRFNI